METLHAQCKARCPSQGKGRDDDDDDDNCVKESEVPG